MISVLAFFFFFPLRFLVLQQNANVITKAFVIATIFWEKWCIICQKCRGANIFDHDCTSVGAVQLLLPGLRTCMIMPQMQLLRFFDFRL